MLKANKSYGPFLLLALLSPLLISLAGCRTLEVSSKPSNMWKPPSWYDQSKKPKTVLAVMQESKPSIEKPMRLVELVGLALENYPSTKQAWYQALSAKAQVGEAQSAWYPTVTAEQDFDTQHTVYTDIDYDRAFFYPLALHNACFTDSNH